MILKILMKSMPPEFILNWDDPICRYSLLDQASGMDTYQKDAVRMFIDLAIIANISYVSLCWSASKPIPWIFGEELLILQSHQTAGVVSDER
jgi:hypothetical protein